MVNTRGTPPPSISPDEWKSKVIEEIASFISTEASPKPRRKRWFSTKLRSNINKTFLTPIHNAVKNLKPGEMPHLRHTTKQSRANYDDALAWARKNIDALLQPSVADVNSTALEAVVQNTAASLDPEQFTKQLDYPGRKPSSTTTQAPTTTQPPTTTEAPLEEPLSESVYSMRQYVRMLIKAKQLPPIRKKEVVI